MDALIENGLENTDQSAARLSAVITGLSENAVPHVLRPGDPGNEADADKLAMESLFSALEERGVNNPKKLTEFEVYARLEEYGKRAKKE